MQGHLLSVARPSLQLAYKDPSLVSAMRHSLSPPVLHLHPLARGPFLEYDDKEERRRQKTDKAEQDRQAERARRKARLQHERKQHAVADAWPPCRLMLRDQRSRTIGHTRLQDRSAQSAELPGTTASPLGCSTSAS